MTIKLAHKGYNHTMTRIGYNDQTAIVTNTMTHIGGKHGVQHNKLTAPVNISNINVPRLHQSTALPWPDLYKISGALRA